MKIGPLTEDGINSVIDNISEDCKKEAEMFGVSLDQLRAKFMEMVREPFTGSFYDGNICCSICALHSIGTFRWRVHLVSAEGRLKRIVLSITRFLKKISDDMVRRGGYIEILSDYSERTDRWHGAMGFKLTGTDGPIHKYTKGG